MKLRCTAGWLLLAALLRHASASPQQSAAEIFHQGAAALHQGQLDEAEKDFRAVIALDPQSSAAYVNLGVALMRRQRWSEALTALQRADQLHPAQAGVQLNIGLVYYRQNQFSNAIPALTEALRSNPGEPQASYLLGLCYFFTAQYQAASASLAPLWNTQQNNLNYLYVLTIAAGKSGDDVLQKQSFDRMLELGRDQPEFHLYIGKAWLAQNNAAEALKEFNMAAAANPNLPMVHHFLGRTYLQQHDYTKAESEFLLDVAHEPQIASNYEDLGTLYAAIGQPEKAGSQFRAALAHDPTLVTSYLGLAQLERQQNHHHEALALLDRAVALAPHNASVHYLRAQELARTGNPAAAKQEFTQASDLLKQVHQDLEQDPSGDHAADAQDAARQ